MSEKSIIEIITLFENLRQDFNAASHDLDKKIRDLEKVRYQYSSQVELDGTNPEIRTKLLNTERELMELKKSLRLKNDNFSKKVKELRAKFIHAHNSIIEQSKAKVKTMEAEREKLRDELIPDVERKLSEYNDRKKKLDLEILNLITRLNDLEKEGEQWLQKM